MISETTLAEGCPAGCDFALSTTDMCTTTPTPAKASGATHAVVTSAVAVAVAAALL